ncbi:hypothetical protein [Cryobacterium sp. Y62]|uniref:hypothetical protein n=1 Tax=Cryobacterium sp. Y62 TaxID=2048284 RepID=UPI001304911B|nr:hypothetical protein [Cryobacterium sp. Y62]
MSRRRTYEAPARHRFSIRSERLADQLTVILWLTNAAIILAFAIVIVSMQLTTGATQ